MRHTTGEVVALKYETIVVRRILVGGGIPYSWVAIINEVLKRKAHENIIVPKHEIVPPLEDPIIRFEETMGEPRGQLRDYEYTLPDGRRIHVREFNNYYEVHWDYVSPKIDPIGHLVLDAPHWLKLISVLGMALIGLALAKNEKDRLRNLAVGALAGLLIAELLSLSHIHSYMK